MRFLWTTLYVRNMDESIAFYQNILDLKILQRFQAGPGRELTFLGNGTTDETQVELICDAAKTAREYSDPVSLGFAVPSVDAMLETIRGKNIPLRGDPVETPKFKFITIADPDGMSVQLFQSK